MSVANVTTSCSFPPDPTLTLERLLTATKGVKDWSHLGNLIDIPWSKLEEIGSLYSDDDQRLRAVLEVWLNTHPAPSWSLLAEGLYRSREHDVLQRVREQYITGRRPQCTIPVHVSPPTVHEINCYLVFVTMGPHVYTIEC